MSSPNLLIPPFYIPFFPAELFYQFEEIIEGEICGAGSRFLQQFSMSLSAEAER